jgi:hypothetical protein
MKRNARGFAWNSAAARRLRTLAGGIAAMDDAVEAVVSRVAGSALEPPTDLHAVAASLRVQTIRAAELPVAGQLRRVAGGLEILYSRDQSIERRRFTIAHELGHAILETTGPRCPRRGVELERLCDMIASELLMPRQVFINYFTERPHGPQSVLEAAELFRTSKTSAALRYAQLFGVTAAILEHGEITVTSDPRVRRSREIRDLLLAANAQRGAKLARVKLGRESRDIEVHWEWLGTRSHVLIVIVPRRLPSQPSEQASWHRESRPTIACLRALAERISERDPEAARAAVLEALLGGDGSIDPDAVGALADVPRLAVIAMPLLCEWLGDDRVDVRRAAAGVLRSVAPVSPGAIVSTTPILAAALEDVDSVVRMSAVWTLGALERAGLSALEPALAASHDDVRMTAEWMSAAGEGQPIRARQRTDSKPRDAQYAKQPD